MDLIVLGSARCIWSDFAAASGKLLGKNYEVMAVNDIGMHFPGDLRHWYSNDAWMLSAWKRARRPDYNKNIILHTNNGAGTFIKDDMKVWDWVCGNSGINAVQTGIALGYNDIYVCGIPLDESGHYFDPEWKKTSYSNENAFDEWRRYRLNWGGHVKSMSGNTKLILEGAL